MITSADVGRRVSLRHRPGGGRPTDVVGRLTAADADLLTVRRADGGTTAVRRAELVAGRVVGPAPVRVRPARRADAAGIEAVRLSAWRAAYRGLLDDAYLAALTADPYRWAAVLGGDGPVRAQVAVGDRRVVGYALFGPDRQARAAEPPVGEVYALYVDPDRWGEGIGGRLLRAALAGLAGLPVRLWVLAANAPARGFYEHAGFVRDGARRTVELDRPRRLVRYRREP